MSLTHFHQQRYWGLFADLVKNNHTHSITAIVQRFKSYGISGSTVHTIFGPLLTRRNAKSTGKGRILKEKHIHLRNKIFIAGNGKVGIFQRLLATKLIISISCVCFIVK